jgi:hypothetical protein
MIGISYPCREVCKACLLPGSAESNTAHKISNYNVQDNQCAPARLEISDTNRIALGTGQNPSRTGRRAYASGKHLRAPPD